MRHTYLLSPLAIVLSLTGCQSLGSRDMVATVTTVQRAFGRGADRVAECARIR